MEHSRRVRPRRRREPPRPPIPAIVNPRGQPPYRPGIDPDLPTAGRWLGPYGPRTGPGDVFRVTATLANNANRPVPAVLRMEVRNPNNTVPNELTVYAGCGAEEVVSGTRLIYYIGWHGPLLAPKGTSFAAGTNLATLDAAIGSAEYWPAVLHEIQERDPAGYASLVVPGLNASAGVRASGSALLKALNYYAMAASANADSPNLGDWTLSSVFSERFVAFGGRAQDGFLVEVHPQSSGSFIFKLWAERPDGLGIPDHPTYTCGPL